MDRAGLYAGNSRLKQSKKGTENEEYHLSREIDGLHATVQALYVEIWDAIQAEPEGPVS